MYVKWMTKRCIMSLRWKLFRFLSVDTLLSPTPAESVDYESSLFPSLSKTTLPTSTSGAIKEEDHNETSALLTKFATIADRSFHSFNIDTIFAFALPRALVHIFNVPFQNVSSTPTSNGIKSPLKFPSNVSFSAHDNAVIAVHLVKTNNALPLLVTIGLDNSGSTVKIWQLNLLPSSSSTTTLNSDENNTNVNDDDHENLMECICSFKLQGGARPTTLAVNTLAESPYLSSIAIGFVDGVIILLSGNDILSGRIIKTRIGPAPGEMIEPKPIISLNYTSDNVLYIVSEISISIIMYNKKDKNYIRKVLDNSGIKQMDECCLYEYTNELIISKSEGLYFFNNHDGKRSCLAFSSLNSKKPFVSSFFNYYIVHASANNVITIYDIINKIIVYRGKGIINCMFQLKAFNCMIICINDGSILKFSEIDLNTRVNMLLKRGLYLSAVNLAKLEYGNNNNQSKIFNYKVILIQALKQYAEYLMNKNKYDEAADQLIETIHLSCITSTSVKDSNIDVVEPSWVITKLVEQSGLRSGLRKYLEALHKVGIAEFVHTKVLITCYKHDRLRSIILNNNYNKTTTTDEYVIDVFNNNINWDHKNDKEIDQIIELFRNSGLFLVAESIAKQKNRYIQLSKILIDDLSQYQDVLTLLISLSTLSNNNNHCLLIILQCGQKLLHQIPADFVAFLTDFISKSSPSTNSMSNLHQILPLFVDMPKLRAQLLQKILARPGILIANETPRVWILLFESLVCVDLGERIHNKRKFSDQESQAQKDQEEEGNEVGEENNKVQAVVIYDRKIKVGKKALKILQNRWSVIDLRGALEVAEQYGHQLCLEYLYEHLRMYKKLGVCLRLSCNYHGLLKACRRHGEREPYLWLEALRLFVPVIVHEESNCSNNNVDTDIAGNESIMNNDDIQMDIVNDTECKGQQQQQAEEETGEEVVGDGTDPAEEDEEDEEDEEEEKQNININAQDVVDESMQVLERSGILSTYEIIELIVGTCGEGKWGIVREFFEKYCSTLRRDTISSEHASTSLENETNELRKEAIRLRDETIIIKPKTCAICEDVITLPAIHFFCGHSYHASCLNSFKPTPEQGKDQDQDDENIQECIKCAPELDAILSMKKAVIERNEKHDEFFAALHSARDGFSTIIEFLERSPFL